MKTEVKIVIPAFRLGDIGNSGESVDVENSDLRKADIGTIWETRNNCGSDIEGASAEVVYKTEKGAAVLFRFWKVIDANNPKASKPKVREEAPRLGWYEFR